MRNFGVVGAQDDEGVLNVGGRIGAVRGPVSFSQAIKKLNGFEAVNLRISTTIEVDPDPSGIEKTHERVRDAVLLLRQQGLSDIVIGGGHDHVLPQIEAHSQAGRTVGCLNIDAHFDLRKPNPKLTSGSPFYAAIERGFIKPENLTEFGIQKQANNKDVQSYAIQKKIKTIWFDELRDGLVFEKFRAEFDSLVKKVDHLILSIDLDAFSESFAPGVSAPQAEGFTPTEGIQMIEYAARSGKNASLGIFELNPLFDQDSRTARLAATLVWKWIGATT